MYFYLTTEKLLSVSYSIISIAKLGSETRTRSWPDSSVVSRLSCHLEATTKTKY